jgi:hypothetical protein
MPSNGVPAKKNWVEVVYQVRLLGALPFAAASHLRSEGHEFTAEEFDRLWAESDEMIRDSVARGPEETAEDERKRWADWLIAANLEHHARCIAAGDNANAIRCRQEVGRLRDVYPEVKKPAADAAGATINIVEVIIEQPRRDHAHLADQDAPDASPVRRLEGPDSSFLRRTQLG